MEGADVGIQEQAKLAAGHRDRHHDRGAGRRDAGTGTAGHRHFRRQEVRRAQELQAGGARRAEIQDRGEECAEGCARQEFRDSNAGRAPDRRSSERLYDAIWRDGLHAATRVGGTISHHHGVGLLKAPYMNGEHREAMAVLRALKRTLDPDDIMNPGKLGLDGAA